jgi:polyketide cyclase/dehydrase/lipid transport protein
MNPITFSCEETLPLAPEEIARQILDLTKWPDFHGYGPIPGIKVAAFEVQTPGVVGSRIRVANRDGSSHIEEIVEWQPDHRLRLRMKDFSAPLSRWATEFEETWEFQRTANGTHVTRSFRLHAKSALARLLLWGISFFLKRAIARHLREMR